MCGWIRTECRRRIRLVAEGARWAGWSEVRNEHRSGQTATIPGTLGVPHKHRSAESQARRSATPRDRAPSPDSQPGSRKGETARSQVSSISQPGISHWRWFAGARSNNPVPASPWSSTTPWSLAARDRSRNSATPRWHSNNSRPGSSRRVLANPGSPPSRVGPAIPVPRADARPRAVPRGAAEPSVDRGKEKAASRNPGAVGFLRS